MAFGEAAHFGRVLSDSLCAQLNGQPSDAQRAQLRDIFARGLGSDRIANVAWLPIAELAENLDFAGELIASANAGGTRDASNLWRSGEGRPAVAEASGAFHGGAAVAADPNRQMRLLERT